MESGLDLCPYDLGLLIFRRIDDACMLRKSTLR